MSISGSQQAYKAARANIERAGASRAGYLPGYGWRLKIGSTDRTDKLLGGTMRVTRAVGEEPSTATFVTRDITPTELEEVRIGWKANTGVAIQFGGNILTAEKLPVRAGAKTLYRVTACDWAYRFNSRRVYNPGDYPAQFDTTRQVNDVQGVVKDIVSRFCPGFTTYHVQSVPGSVDRVFTGERPTEAIAALANNANCVTYLDPLKDVWLYPRGAHPWGALTVDTTLTAPTRYEKLNYVRDATQLRTRAFVIGRGTTLSAANYGFSFEVTDNLAFDASPVSGVTTLTVYILGSLRTLLYNTATLWDVVDVGVDPIVAPKGTPINVCAVVDDSAAQTTLAALFGDGHDGVYEFVVKDERLSYEGCQQRGAAELAMRKSVGVKGTIDLFTLPCVGQQLLLNIPERGLSSVTVDINKIQLRTDGDSIDRMRATVSFDSRPPATLYNVLRDSSTGRFIAA